MNTSLWTSRSCWNQGWSTWRTREADFDTSKYGKDKCWRRSSFPWKINSRTGCFIGPSQSERSWLPELSPGSSARTNTTERSVSPLKSFHMHWQLCIVLSDTKANQLRNGFSLVHRQSFLIGGFKTSESNKWDCAEALNEWLNSFQDQKTNRWRISNQFYLTHSGTSVLLPVHLTHFRFSCLAFHSIETKGIILSMGGTNQILKMISTCNREMF